MTASTGDGPGILPVDQTERDRIRDDLGTTLFVEAGAGSGKTTALVDRVVRLITSGTAELRTVAAITFTEKAAAELRDRVRRRLEETEGATDPLEPVAQRCRAALDQLDGAAIGTLHAFAQRILAENPIEVGLPPRVEVLDEVSSDVGFERRWSSFRDQLLADRDLERTLLLLFGAGVKINALRAMAVEFDRNWDLVDERVPAHAPDPAPLHTHLGAALESVREVCRRSVDCSDPSDKLAVRLAEVATYVEQLEQITDELDLIEELQGKGSIDRPSFNAGSFGSAKNWGDAKADVQAALKAAAAQLDSVAGDVAQACARRVAVDLRRFTLDAVEQRRNEGTLAFHDLLVMARQLVRNHPEARRRLHQRYRHLLLDEFQDTDPIQIEIAVRIAAADPDAAATGVAPWEEVPVRSGHLFVVGDPKQSIYRFRRADISMFLAARSRYGADGGLVTLSTNFRTGAPVIEWVNHTFGHLLGEAPETETPTPSQPDYVDLAPVRPEPPVGPPVAVIGRQAFADADAAMLRHAEATDVAATVARILDEGWSVGTGIAEDPWRPARLGDITVLVPARTSLPFLEDALDGLAVPYRAESSSLVYASRAIRDLFATLRAIDDPTDHLSIVTALRTPLFACGDDDLFTYKVTGRGQWNYLAPRPAGENDGPVADALDYLRRLHRERHWRSPAELADRVARERRLFELGFAEGRTRDVWRRLRFVIDQAREWGEATNGGLRDYLQWIARQTGEGSRVAEAVLPETDDDAVRIMTIHAAKGLEFPITILSGMTTGPRVERAPAQVAFPPGGGVGYRFGPNVITEEFEAWKPIDEQMGYDERIRLLYVACTRAEDHLVVSLQRKLRAKPAGLSKRTNAELLVDGTGDLLAGLPEAVEAGASPIPLAATAPPSMPAPFDEWESELSDALRRGSRPTTVAATALSADGAPDVGDALAGSASSGAVPPSNANGVSGDVPRWAGIDEAVTEGEPAEPVQLDLGLDTGEAPSFQPHGASERASGETSGQRGRRADASAGASSEGGPISLGATQEVDDADGAGVDDVDPGLEKRPRDLDLPPWLKGRYGTAVGRAVHATLQTVDLADPVDFDAAVAAQCEAEAIGDRTREVGALARSALDAPVVRAAAGGPVWREVYACTPTAGGRLLEGYIDLLYRTEGGMVVVDYKTAATDDPVELARRVAGYRLQGAAYALAVGATTGERVARVTFLFLTPTGAVEIDLPDVDAAIAEVEALVAQGNEHVVA